MFTLPNFFVLTYTYTMPLSNFLACSRRLVAVLSILVCQSYYLSAQTSTGPKSPSVVSEIGSGLPWSSPGNVSSENGSYASVGVLINSDHSKTLIARGFGFSIPATDVIDGITVEIKRRVDQFFGGAADRQVQLTKNGTTFIGNSEAAPSAWPSSDTWASYGGTTNLWNTTWTAGEVNSPTFGVCVSVDIAGLAASAMIDHIKITVHHHAAILPVSLVSFEAAVTDRHSVNLVWSTASEINNDFFSIEKSRDGEKYFDLTEVKGSGNTNTACHYAYEDRQPYTGRSYYRLKQTDFDGTFTYSKAVKVDYDGPARPVLTLIPNPTMGSSIRFRIVGLNDTGAIPMVIYDLQGRVVAQQEYFIAKPGVMEGHVKLQSPLASGLYIVKAGPGLQMTRKLIVR